MAFHKYNPTNDVGGGCIIACQQVSKSLWTENQTLCDWLEQFTTIQNVHRFEMECLRLVREPRFQDKRLRPAQAKLVIQLGLGDTADVKPTGRLLTQYCLVRARKVHATRERAKVARNKPMAETRLTESAVDEVDVGDAASHLANDKAREVNKLRDDAYRQARATHS